jgi:hypothetical protein
VVLTVHTEEMHDFSRFAWSVYKSCEDSSPHLKTVAHKVSELYILIKQTGELLKEDSITINTPTDKILEECYHILQEIQDVLDMYKTYGVRGQRTWDRMGYGIENAKRLEEKLATNLQDLRNFNLDLKK